MARCPVWRMSKKDIVKLAKWRCKHGETGLSHYNCWLRSCPEEEKRGYLDIEASNLHASFGIVLCYAIKDSKSDTIYSRAVTARELRTCLDYKVVKQCVKDMQRFDRICTFYGCVTPGQRILTNDLKWVPVETLQPGDKITSFSEQVTEKWHKRIFEEGEVLHNIPIEKDIFEIKLEDGTSLEATSNHPWLVKRGESSRVHPKSGYWKFRATKELQHSNCDPPSLLRILPTWDSIKSYDAGYVAAFIDGEGCVNQSYKGRSENDFGLCVSASQNEGEVLDKFADHLNKVGYGASISRYDPSNKRCISIRISGGKHNVIKFLGEVRPQKLSTLDINKLGIIHQYGEKIPIISIKFKGKGTVMGLGTSTGTYIVEGFGSHNSRFDLPFLRTRALASGIEFPEYGSLYHTDMYFMARSKLRLHSNRLEQVCRTLFGETTKTHIDPARWIKALQGNIEALSYIQEHCKQDTLELERVYNRLINYGSKTNTSV